MNAWASPYPLGGSGANRTLTITPVPNAMGTATITVSVSDGSETATDAFVLTVGGTVLMGDANHDGAVDLADAILVLQILTGGETTQTLYPGTDLNGGGRISLPELIFILQHVSRGR